MKKKILSLLSLSKNNTVINESGRMYIAEGIGIFFAFLIVIVRSKFLTVDEVGLISYIVAMITLTSAFFNFGLDNTTARVVLNEKTGEGKKIVTGTALLLSIMLAIGYGIVLVFINLSVPLWGKTDIQPYVYMILPFAGYNIILLSYKQLCFANGAIHEVSIQLYISYGLYLLFLIISKYCGFLTVTTAIIASYGINMLTVVIPIIIFHKQYLKFDKDSIKKICIEQKERGWKIYLSRVLFSSTFNLDTMILGLFHPLDSVAFYSIAKYIAMPVSMVGNSVSQSIYRKYAGKNQLSRRLVIKVFVVTLIAAVVMFTVGIIMIAIMGEKYKPMLGILPISIIYSIVNGTNSMYNSYMNAKGMANELRNLSIISAIANVVFNFALIIPFGAYGGVIASLIVVFIVLGLRIYYCKKYDMNEKGAET